MRLVSTEKAPKALGPYSQGYVHGGILYSAGQIAINPATDTVEADTIEGQADQVCKNIGAILEEAGTSFDKVLKTTCFLADMGDFAAYPEKVGGLALWQKKKAADVRQNHVLPVHMRVHAAVRRKI